METTTRQIFWTVVAKAGHGQMKHSMAIQIGINGINLSLMNLRVVHDYGPIRMVHGMEEGVTTSMLIFVKKVKFIVNFQ